MAYTYKILKKLFFHALWTLKSGMHGKFMKVIIPIYNELTACISTPEGLTEFFFKCFIGTRQGCMLSPLLLILYLYYK